jgi:NADH-quinone oxidoreductase subunit M
MTLTLLAAMGMPGTLGFVAEFYTIIAGFREWGWVMVFFSISILITASYALRTITLLFTGPVKKGMQDIKDLHSTEVVAAGLLVILIIALGLMPASLLDLSASSIALVNSSFTGAL